MHVFVRYLIVFEFFYPQPSRLKVHLRFFCGPDAQKSDALAKQQKKKSTKLGNNTKSGKNKKIFDEEEYDPDTDDDIPGFEDIDEDDALQAAQSLVGEGDWEDEAAMQAAKMIAADLEMKRRQENKVHVSPLHKINWRRIVLDEAHAVKSRNTNTAKAVFSLQSKYRWALSGTPLQNRVSELYSLIRFLRLNPYSYYFCKKCDCMSLEYPFKKTMAEEFVTHRSQCDDCEHGPMSHYCWWNKWVANPIKRHGFSGKGAKAMITLKNYVLDKTLLRRTKVQQASVLALPPRVVIIRRVEFDVRERDYYEAMYTKSQAQFNTFVEAGTVLNNYAHVFDLLIRLRQAVNHPYLVIFSNTALAAAQEGALSSSNKGASGANDLEICALCRDPPEDPVVASCTHIFCRMCASEYLEAAEPGTSTCCPACNAPLSVNLHLDANENLSVQQAVSKGKRKVPKSFLSRLNVREFQSSTKIEALREEIHDMLEADPSAKAIVFSQFTSMLDLCQYRLEQTGISCVKLSGSMSLKAREQVIDRFTHDPDVCIFLMSLKAGGVALNLTAASHCFLIDSWWNPATEQQAFDRIHRLGQFKPMRCVKLVISNSVEERVIALQQKKNLIFEATVGGDVEALGRLTEDDMKFLFN